MPRKKLPKYRHHKASSLAVVSLNGRDHNLGQFNTRQSRAAYEKLIQEWKANGCSSTFGVKTGATVAMLINDYLDFCEGYYPDTANSETKQSKIALRFLEPYFDEPATEFGQLKTVRETLLQCKVRSSGKPYTRQYVNSLVARICRMFRWAAENEIVPINTYQAIANVPGLKKSLPHKKATAMCTREYRSPFVCQTADKV